MPSSSPPPEYSSLPEHEGDNITEVDDDDDVEDFNETVDDDDYDQVYTELEINPISLNTTITTTTTTSTTAASTTTVPHHYTPLSHHLRLLADDLSTMSEYSAINLDNYCNYIREINDVNTNGNRRRIDNTNYSSSSYY